MSNTKDVQKGKVLEGKVVSVSMNKTVAVAVTHFHRHPLYQKSTRRTKNMLAHNEVSDVHVGDMVRIIETKPISKRVHFKVVGKAGI